MIDTPQKINSWLEKMFANRENGIFLDSDDLNSFDAIQDFLEAKDHPHKTPAIYYQAFVDDSLPELLDTLEEELRLKLGLTQSQSCADISEVIALAELKTVILDRSHFYSWEMIDELWQWLANNQVNLILIATKSEIYDLKILNHPAIAQWDKFIAHADVPNILVSGCSCLVV